MKKSFSARRVPRKIGGDGEDESPLAQGIEDETQAPTVVKRPFSKSRKSASLRSSLGPSSISTDDDDESAGVVTPKRSSLSRIAIQKNAEKRGAAEIPFRSGREDPDEQPSYSKGYLDELRQSTPSTPRDISVPTTYAEDEGTGTSRALDLSSKFGNDLSRYSTPTAIPTDAEIREKKERRSRLAKENDYMSLDASDKGSDASDSDENVTRDDQGRLILKPVDRQPETRLVRDDEDILEDFDDYTSDGRLALGPKAEREQATQRKAEMAAMIADAEGIEMLDDADDDGQVADSSEEERNAAFEDAQTRHGRYGTRQAAEQEGDLRPATPPQIAPLPTFEGVMGRLRRQMEELQIARNAKVREMEGLKAEKKTIAEEKVRVQTALKETGEKYAQLREEMGLDAAAKNEVQVVKTNGAAYPEDEDVDEGDEDRAPGMSLGFGGGGGLGFGGGGNTFIPGGRRAEASDSD